ncbi:MAG: hypothetical protein IPK26_30035 [Planctomycetes bacterium]|nr:hypothetical protein [Planctomycetota bacterium]
MKSLLLPLAGLALATAALAQTPDNLIGITRTTPILAQRDHAGCANLPFCNPPGFPAAPAVPYAGGTAWEPAREAAWISNGFLMALVRPGACNYLCPPFPAPLVSPNAMVTGLEHCESINETWILDSFGNIYRCPYACPLVPVAVCNTGLPLTATSATGGLAVDEKNRIVFYTYTDWTTSATRLFMATMAAPCTPFQIVAVPGCGGMLLRGVTGLAVDACSQTLYLTDGVTTMGWSYTVAGGPTVVFGAQTCCTLPPPMPGDQMIGLAVRSGRPTSTGATCANGACPACPMLHGTIGSPNLGNANFTLDLQSAPLGALAWCIVGVGPCVPPGPFFPPLCGPIQAGPMLGTLGPVPTGGGVGCGGSAAFPLGLPMIPGLCGAVLSSQCVAFCSAGGMIGTSLSNCLTWQIQSN